jgi:hypothetical protein
LKAIARLPENAAELPDALPEAAGQLCEPTYRAIETITGSLCCAPRQNRVLDFWYGESTAGQLLHMTLAANFCCQAHHMV